VVSLAALATLVVARVVEIVEVFVEVAQAYAWATLAAAPLPQTVGIATVATFWLEMVFVVAVVAAYYLVLYHELSYQRHQAHSPCSRRTAW
jgi:hypothetical protein